MRFVDELREAEPGRACAGEILTSVEPVRFARQRAVV